LYIYFLYSNDIRCIKLSAISVGILAGDISVGGSADEVTIGRNSGVDTGVLVFSTSSSEGSDTILEPGSIRVLDDERSTRISLASVLTLDSSTDMDFRGDVSGVFLFTGVIVDEWDVDLTEFSRNVSIFFGGSPASGPGSVGFDDSVIVLAWDTDGLNVVTEGDVLDHLDKSDIPERIGIGDVLRMEVDLLNFMDNFSSFVGSLFIEDTSLDSEAARAVGATVDTVTSSHDPVRSDDGTSAFEITSEPVIFTPDNLPRPGILLSDGSSDDLCGTKIRGNGSLSTFLLCQS